MGNIKLFELKKIQSNFPKTKITSSNESFDFISQFYGDDLEIYESFFVLLLNRANITIGYAKISQGGIAGTVVDKLIVAKYVVDSLAKGVILAHNHPSGGTKASEQDKIITREIKKGLSLFDVVLLDHIILCGNNKFVSFADEGLL
jgi:DNA repair protein RadC